VTWISLRYREGNTKQDFRLPFRWLVTSVEEAERVACFRVAPSIDFHRNAERVANKRLALNGRSATNRTWTASLQTALTCPRAA